MAYTTQDLTEIERAIASGARRVRFADQEVEYRSLAELLRARDEVRRALQLPISKGPFGGREHRLYQTSKGL